MKTKFTPGPWEVRKHGGPNSKLAYIHAESSWFHDAIVVVYDTDTPPGAGNAQAISALPELVAALDYCREELEILAEMFPRAGKNRAKALEYTIAALQKAGVEL